MMNNVFLFVIRQMSVGLLLSSNLLRRKKTIYRYQFINLYIYLFIYLFIYISGTALHIVFPCQSVSLQREKTRTGKVGFIILNAFCHFNWISPDTVPEFRHHILSQEPDLVRPTRLSHPGITFLHPHVRPDQGRV